MPLGGATKKLQKLVDTAEELYQRVNELREEINALRDTVQTTNETVERLETDLDQQRALVEALAHERGIDVDRVLAEAAIDEAEQAGEPSDTATPDDDPNTAEELDETDGRADTGDPTGPESG